MRSLLFFKLTFLLILGANNLIAKELNDRILFTIGSQAYSQLEMQAYLQVKLALKTDAKPVSFKNNYNELFYNFLDDMIVHSQSTKIFDVSFEEKQKNNILVAKKILTQKTFIEQEINSALPEKKILNILKIIQSIEMFKTTQNTDSKKQWIKKLKQKTDFRIFKNAKTYIPISVLK